MTRRMRAAAGAGNIGAGMVATAPARASPPAMRPPHERTLAMTWTTPKATDLRFGFEITMYVSAR